MRAACSLHGAHRSHRRLPDTSARPQAWWLKVLLVMAVVGVVLLDVYLLEAVLDRVRTHDSSGRASLEPPGPGWAGAGGGGARPRAAAAAAAASLMSAVHSGTGRLMVLKELAQSALAIVPRGAGGAGRNGAFVGDDPAAAQPAAADGDQPRGAEAAAPAATLNLLDGLLPSRRQQSLAREQREWQQLRQRYKSLELSKQGALLGRLKGKVHGADSGVSLPTGFRIPHPTNLPRIRPAPSDDTTTSATLAAAGGGAAGGGGSGGESLLRGPLPFVGLKGARKTPADANFGRVVPPGASAGGTWLVLAVCWLWNWCDAVNSHACIYQTQISTGAPIWTTTPTSAALASTAPSWRRATTRRTAPRRGG